MIKLFAQRQMVAEVDLNSALSYLQTLQTYLILTVKKNEVQRSDQSEVTRLFIFGPGSRLLLAHPTALLAHSSEQGGRTISTHLAPLVSVVDSGPSIWPCLSFWCPLNTWWPVVLLQMQTFVKSEEGTLSSFLPSPVPRHSFIYIQKKCGSSHCGTETIPTKYP